MSFQESKGNAGNISHRLEKVGVFRDLGVDTFIIDYRGYGRSEGQPGEEGTYRDAQAAYEYLTQQRKLKPRYTMELDSSELLKRFVAADAGVGFIARSNVLEDMRANALAAIPISDATRGHGTHTVATVWKQYLIDFLAQTEKK